jgi:DNA-binding response OmpR family regulator
MQKQRLEPPVAQLTALDVLVRPHTYMLESGVCTIGRADICQIIVPKSLVSRLHARIERTGPRYMLRDTHSANGTFVNGQRISEPHLLKHHDRIALGTLEEVLQFHDPDATFTPAGSLFYNDRAMVFLLHGKRLELPKQQLLLLVHLYQHVGDICTRESCAEAIWGQDYDPIRDTHALDETVRKLRESLRQIDPQADFIKTRRGFGYELVF